MNRNESEARREDRWPVAIYLALVAFSILGSLASRLTGVDPGPIARPAALLTLAAGCVASFWPLVRQYSGRAFLALAAVWVIGCSSELAGLWFGLPFGRYAYTDRWWPVFQIPRVGFFPLQLPFAWSLVVGSAYLIASGKGKPSVWIAALGATLVDLIMEPTMTSRLGYWRWLDRGPLPGGVPITNAAGWFVVSLAAAVGMREVLGPVKVPGASARWVLAAYVLLVVVLNFSGQI